MILPNAMRESSNILSQNGEEARWLNSEYLLDIQAMVFWAESAVGDGKKGSEEKQHIKQKV